MREVASKVSSSPYSTIAPERANRHKVPDHLAKAEDRPVRRKMRPVCGSYHDHGKQLPIFLKVVRPAGGAHDSDCPRAGAYPVKIPERAFDRRDRPLLRNHISGTGTHRYPDLCT